MDNNIIDLQQYSYPQGEEAVLTTLLRNQHVDSITNQCQEHFFFNNLHKRAFIKAKEYAYDIGKGCVNYLAVRNMLQADGTGTNAISYLDSIMNKDSQELPALDYSLERLKTLSTRRNLLSALQEKMVQAQDMSKDITELVSDTENTVASIGLGTNNLTVISGKDLVTKRYEGIHERYYTKPVFTGWDGFDEYLSVGFAPGKLSIIAGRTSMGKSFFKSNLIINMCNNGVGVVNVCPEQGLLSEHNRIDAIMTGVHLKKITRINELEIGDPTFAMLKKNVEKIAHTWNYAAVPDRDISVAGIRASIRQARRLGKNPQIVFIDLFDRLSDVNVGKDRVANMSRKLGQIEQIADQENVHMCLLVQVNRGPEKRPDKRPSLSELRECGHFEQDADLVFLLYREGYYSKDPDVVDNTLDVQIAKQRDGIMGIIYQFFILDTHTLQIAPSGVRVETPNTGSD